MAQQLKLDFQGGLVSVEANGVPVRTILTEWGKVGGTKIVGAERIAGVPLTVKLVNVSEAKALETLLRSVAGYMAAPRSTIGAGPSMYDRILVMATSSSPAPAAGRPTPQPPTAADIRQQRFAPPRQRAEAAEQPEQDEPEERDENPPNPPVFTFPAQGQNGFTQPGQFNGAPGQNGMIINPGSAPPQGITINPAPAPGQSVPGMPLGSATPGMVVQPPPQPGQRPPGRQQ